MNADSMLAPSGESRNAGSAANESTDATMAGEPMTGMATLAEPSYGEAVAGPAEVDPLATQCATVAFEGASSPGSIPAPVDLAATQAYTETVDSLGGEATIADPSRTGARPADFSMGSGGEADVETLVADLPNGPGHVRVKPLGAPGDSADRYTRTRLHAKGGLGVVWMVQDQTIGRQVALKELRPERGKDARVWGRFLEEARITGQLEHPSIVPIYELAEDAETGKPYYTMRFIRGNTLTDACNEYHKQRGQGPHDPLRLQTLLSSFVGICQAVAYAHSKGVIHRDLKGQNVVLGDFGEVIVLDWGLAKVIGRPDDIQAQPITAGENDDRSSLETSEGQVLGTPSYMPPEQALGELDRIDRRSDIYSLGAVLYEILTGKPPFRSSKITELLNSVIRGDFQPPRQVDPAVPRALEAICLKAMAKAQDDRYQSAAELAREVQRYLADEPVDAYPEPWATRARRWAKKHRSTVAAAAVVLVASVAILSVANVLVSRERDRVRIQREIARRAVDEMYTDVAEQWLEDRSDPLQQKFLDRALASYERRAADTPAEAGSREPEGEAVAIPRTDAVDAVQQSFLERSLAYYDQFAKQPSEGVRSALDVGQARVRMANIFRKLGKIDEAGRSYERAIGELSALSRRLPGDPGVDRALALAQGRFGSMRVTQGKFEEADRLLERAEAAFRRLSTSPSGVDRDRLEWGRILRERAERLKLSGKTRESELQFRQAIDVLSKLVAKGVPGIEARHELAQAEDALGVMLLLALDRQEDAAKLLREALTLEEGLVRQTPTVPHLRAGLGKTGNTLALILRSEGKTADALGTIGVSLANYQRLADDFPGRPEYRRALARAFLNRGNLEQDDGRVADARASYLRSTTLLATLVKEAPEIAKHHRDLGFALNNLAAMMERQEEIDEAISCYKQAEANDDRLVRRFPGVPEYRESLGIDRRNLARALSKRGQPDDSTRAVELAADALKIFETLAASYPQITAYQRGLAESQFQLGSIDILAGRIKDAEPYLRRAVAGFRPLVERYPRAVAIRRAMVDALINLAEAGPADAEALDREALAHVEVLCKAATAGTNDRFTLAVTLNNLAEIVERKGGLAESQALFVRSERAFTEKGLGGDEPKRLHYLAYVLTNEGKLALKQERLAQAEVYFRLAVDRDRDATKLMAAYRDFLLEDYNQLGALLVKRGDHGGAARLALEMVKAIPDVASARVKAAGLLALCVDLARKESSRSEEDRAALARGYAMKGLAQLRVALDSGFRRIDDIKGNPDLQRLLKEPESQEILPDLVSLSPAPAG